MRWLYHVTAAEEVAAGSEGFVHCSFQPDLAETVRLHFAGRSTRDLRAIRLDPRRLADVRVEGARAMPHVYGGVPRDAVGPALPLDTALDAAPDRVTSTRIMVAGFAGMTLLDLVGALDPLVRIVSMGVDASASVEVVSLTDAAWSGAGATFAAARVRPPLGDVDVLVVAGGAETRALEGDADVVAWLRTFPETRLAASVCTGALLLGAAGRLRGKRATTHHASLEALGRFEATAVSGERVVRDGMVVTAGGVTSGIDLGLWLVDWLYGAEARASIATRMEYSPPP
jgi:putative intracellular protease/amidase/uncharacterized protein (DUF952 family)